MTPESSILEPRRSRSVCSGGCWVQARSLRFKGIESRAPSRHKVCSQRHAQRQCPGADDRCIEYLSKTSSMRASWLFRHSTTSSNVQNRQELMNHMFGRLVKPMEVQPFNFQPLSQGKLASKMCLECLVSLNYGRLGSVRHEEFWGHRV